MKSNAISVPVVAVTMSSAAEMTHNRRSDLLVSRASFTAAMAMMAITPGAMP